MTSQSSGLDLSAYRDASIDWTAHEGTSINLGAVQHAWVDNIRPYVPIFEELTGIDVVWSILPEQQFRTKRLTDVSTGAGNFDLFFMDQVVNQFGRAGWLKNLDPYFNSDTLFDDSWYNQSDLLQVCRQAAHGAGRQPYWTGLPITVEVQTMFYKGGRKF
jgi:multiple sugar transport system substrate-binding protein